MNVRCRHEGRPDSVADPLLVWPADPVKGTLCSSIFLPGASQALAASSCPIEHLEQMRAASLAPHSSLCESSPQVALQWVRCCTLAAHAFLHGPRSEVATRNHCYMRPAHPPLACHSATFEPLQTAKLKPQCFPRCLNTRSKGAVSRDPGPIT